MPEVPVPGVERVAGQPSPPMPEEPSEPEHEPVADLFWGVARRLRRLSRQALAPWDVSPSHGRALGVLLSHGDLRLSELSDELRIVPRSITEVVDALAERGLAERRPDPDDRRATLVRLTAHGRAVATAIQQARASESEAFFAALDAADRESLARILRRLQAVADADDPVRGPLQLGVDRARRAPRPGSDGSPGGPGRSAADP